MGAAFDLLLVGGGLQNGLIALAALHADPQRRIALVEAGPTIGGNHTWCAHPHDVPAAAQAWARPLFVHQWPGYEVRFPGLRRVIEAPYAAIPSAHFGDCVQRAMQRAPADALHLGQRVAEIQAHAVRLDDGSEIGARLVVDARGPEPSQAVSSAGFQKFLGLEIELEAPHRLQLPILMDATVEQRGGFRFVYSLPFSATRLMVEDTYFSRRADLDLDASRAALLDYVSSFGKPVEIVREEFGVLPMPWASRTVAPHGSPLIAGYRGGWFHPATGYSLPPAIRLACHIAARRSNDVFDSDLQQMYSRHEMQVRFAQFLNRMLFHCFDPVDTWNVFSRFYTLPDDVIHRFYALSMTVSDRARLIIGRPPRGFSFGKALSLIRGS